MSSPFPGMDPFLESNFDWHSFHYLFVSLLLQDLNDRLPQDYAAKAEERLVILEEDRNIFPDISVTRERHPDMSQAPGGRTAVLEQSSKIDAPRIAPSPYERQRYIEIVSLSGKRRVVTVIEVLSPSNKRGEGRQEYHEKQRAVFNGGVNMLEIDLLRGGQPTVALDFDKARALDRSEPYVVCLSRADVPERLEYWPFGLRDRLPRVAVPLGEDDDDLPLDLQAVFASAYDRGRYAQQLDYTAEVTPPFSPEDAEWARSLLANAVELRKG